MTDAQVHALAVILILLAALPALLAWFGARRSAAGCGVFFGIIYLLPMAPRALELLSDRERFVARHGTAALREIPWGLALVAIVGTSMGLMLAHGLSRRGAPRLFWCGWTLQFLLTAFVAYLAWWFRIF
jgi:hypothetical protein